MGFRAAAVCMMLLAWTGMAAAFQPDPPEMGTAQTLPLAPLTVETRKGRVALQVQVADTDTTRQTGLMYRTSMPEREGMLFIFPHVHPVAFWMKNTILPLDIIFVDAAGRIMNIAAGTTPFSLRPITSDGPTKAVLELNAGASARLGIGVGDRVVFEPLVRLP
ncbi:DUF192 domain-containing protein [Emcibacter sp. SYSU 3D8]|uniref:DUF192 domain-containing protein n=1 Tax=Emcibacter sp. SYSU 3D8 TaxID=3133969 RepID=UPI0031FE5ADB